MINARGETIYTNAEIAYEIGLSPATINACGKRLYGNRVAHWTLPEVRRIIEYIKSISIEEDAKRLLLLHEAVEEIMGGKKFDDEETKKQFMKDLYLIDKENK